MRMYKEYRFDGSGRFDIRSASTSETKLCADRKKAEEKMQKNMEEINELQQKLYAEKKEGVIFVYQAMDAAGKDGTIRAVLSCLSPHGVVEKAFKAPSADDLAHDYLYRVHSCVPAKGDIAIFNRSHYEEVLIYKVKELWKSQANADRIDFTKIMERRYEDINGFEKYLWNNNVRIVKIFLHISKQEQAKRFLDRIDEPEKNWKFSEGDYSERKYWDAYQTAFEDCINATSKKHAPWYVVPADHKWYMRYIVSCIILDTLKDMDPQYPEVTTERLAVFAQYKKELETEIGADAKPSKKKTAGRTKTVKVPE